MRIVALRQLIIAGSVFSTFSASAQPGNGRNDKRIAELQARIGEDSAKLIKFKGMIPDFEKQKKSTAEQAQTSADDNRRAADRLSNDPQNKRLARQADDAASQARSDAKKARVAADRLDDLNKDIEKLSRQIGREQAKLEKERQAVVTPAADTTASPHQPSSI